MLVDPFISFSQDDGKITISDSDSDEERISYQNEAVPSQAGGNTGSLNLLKAPGSFEAGGRTFCLVVSHSVSGTLKAIFEIFSYSCIITLFTSNIS